MIRLSVLMLFAILVTMVPKFSCSQSCAPFRYYDAIFQVTKTPDIVYGNAPALTTVYVGENITVSQDLKLDLFEPQGDTLAYRPLVLFAFGGGFLVGSKEDADIQGVCDSLARKGYVTAAINYRLGLNVADNGSAERAVWRGAQDYSAAIRFFKEYADSFRIDTNFIFAGGVSAGSFSLLHCQYATDAQRPSSTFASSFPIAPDLGCKDCSGNNFAHSSAVRAAINCWGAIGDTSWIDALDSVPLLSFHGDADPIVPYGYGFPFTALLTLPQVYGSSLIATRTDHIGLPHQFVSFPGVGHNIWGTVALNAWAPGSPTAFWDPILEDIRDFLYPFVSPSAPIPFGNSMVIQGGVENYAVLPTPGSQYCWSVTGGNIISPPNLPTVSVAWNTLSAQIIRVQEINHLDAVSEADSMVVLVSPVGIENASNAPSIRVFPNPGSEERPIYLQMNFQVPGKGRYSLTDLTGRNTISQQHISWEAGLQTFSISPHLPAGMYFLTISGEDFSITKTLSVISME